jgi:hypothetical protein
MITREALRVAHEECAYLGTIDRQYDDSFAQGGAKIGSTLRIREPNRFTRRQGSRIMDVQDVTETSITATVATQDGVDIRFNSSELALDIDDFSKRYIEPAAKVLISGIESDVLQAQQKLVYNSVGTSGTPMTDLVEAGAARARLNQGLAPKFDRYIQLSSPTAGGMVNGLRGLFHDGSAIKKQYKEGMLGRIAGFDWYENERVWTRTVSADVTGTTDAASLVTDGGDDVDIHTTIATTAVGEVFTIAGVFACHPETKASLGYLQQFVILTGTAGVLTVSPSTYLTGAKQNVCSAAGAQLATTDFDSKTVTFVGAAASSITQNLAYQKEWATFITADLPLMDDAHRCARRTQDGISMRVWEASDIRNDERLMRLDILYGHKVLRPEWACNITD